MSDPLQLREDPFVGRGYELSRLKASLEQAENGHGCLLLIAGEPGIGKSRLIEEWISRTGDRDGKAYWGRCYEDIGAPAFWLWVQVLRDLIRDCDEKTLMLNDGSCAAAIARIIPEVKQRLPDLPALPEFDDASAERFRFFDSVMLLLRAYSEVEPVVIVLEDLHWCDEPSVVLLEYLAGQLARSRMVVIGTYRDTDVKREHRLSKSLTEMIRSSSTSRIRLKGLERNESEQLTEVYTGRNLPASLLGDVAELTEGNPFFIREISVLMREHGSDINDRFAASDFRMFGMPEGIREVIGRKLEPLSEECIELLRYAALIGAAFTVQLMHALFEDMELEAMLMLLDEAMGNEVLVRTPDGVGYRFTHTLIQEAIVDDVSVGGRVRIHATIVAALEGLYGAHSTDHVPEIALHAVEAALLIGPSKAAAYCLSAGNDALSKYAYEAAMEFYEKGLQVAEPDSRDAAELWFGLSRARGCVDWSIYERTPNFGFGEAFEIYKHLNDIDSMIRIASFDLPFWVTDTIAEEALLYAREGSPERAKLLANAAIALVHRTGDYEPAAAMIREASAIAEKLSDDDLRLYVLESSVWIEFDSRHVGVETQNLIDRLSELARALDDAEALMTAIFFKGELVEGKNERLEAFNAALAVAEQLNHKVMIHGCCTHISEIYDALGQWEDSLAFLDRAEETGVRGGRENGCRARIAYQRGERDLARDYIARMRADGEAQLTDHLLLLLEFDAEFLRPDIFIAYLVEQCSRAGSRQNTYDSLLIALFVSAFARNKELTADLYARIMDREEDIVDCDGRWVGFAAHFIGRRQDALVHFNRAYDYYHRSGWRSWLPNLCHDFALALRESDSPDDITRAIELSNEGLNIAVDLGMKPIAEKIRELLSELEKDAGSRSALPDNLTKREIEVLGLIAKGFTNPDIAELLSISDKTVANHATSIYEKTGTANRTEAATYAVINHLI